MNLVTILEHVLSILRGLGASLLCVTVFYLGGVACLPRTWERDSDRFGFPVVLGAAVFVLLSYYGVALGVPLSALIVVYAGLVLGVAAIRSRRVMAAIGDRSAFNLGSLRWLGVFVFLYVLAYAFFTPSVSGELLPLAWRGNADLISYLNHTSYLLRLGPTNIAGFSYLGPVYHQTPGVFYLLGMLSTMFGQEPIRAAMPALFAVTALTGLLAAHVARRVFSTSRLAAVACGAILVSGPFFRLVAGDYFLSTLMAMPVMLHLVWSSVVNQDSNHIPNRPLVARFAAQYLLLLFLYPILFFLGVAAQLAVWVLARVPTGEKGVFDRPAWREEAKPIARRVKVVLLALGVMSACAPLQVAWAVFMAGFLSQKGVAGWPLDFISPLALFGFPGSPDGVAVQSPGQRAWALAALGSVALGMVLLYFWRVRQKTTPAQRAFVGLSAGGLAVYCIYFLLLGPSYQQWKFASYIPLPLSFVAFAAGLRMLQIAFLSHVLTRRRWGRRGAAGLLAITAFAVVGGNLVVHLRNERPLSRISGSLRNLAMIDENRLFREMYVEMADTQSTMLAAYFIRTKELHLVSVSYFPSEPLDDQRVSRGRPLLLHDVWCDGVGHSDTQTIPGVGCLLFGPPSVALDTTYPFSRSFLAVALEGLGGRESWGRWSIRRSVKITLRADSMRAATGSDAYVNFLLVPRFLPVQPPQRLEFAWGKGHFARGSLVAREWISLPVHRNDWQGERLKTLALSIDLPDAVPLRVIDPSTQDPAPVAIGFEEVSLSSRPQGRVFSAGPAR